MRLFSSLQVLIAALLLDADILECSGSSCEASECSFEGSVVLESSAECSDGSALSASSAATPPNQGRPGPNNPPSQQDYRNIPRNQRPRS